MTLSQFTEVWTPLSTSSAALAGFLLGLFLIGRLATDPTFGSAKATGAELTFLTFILIAAIGLVFYGLQTATSVLSNDPGWTRVVSRYALWLLYAATIALGTWLRLRRAHEHRRARAHDRATSELGHE